MAFLGYIEMVQSFLLVVFLWYWWWNRSCLIIDWPIVGMGPALARHLSGIHDFATYILERSGGTFIIKGPWFGGMDILATSDPVNIHYILSKNFANYHKGPEFREIMEPLGDGILSSDSDNWRAQRRVLHSLFNQKRFDAAVERNLEQKMLNRLFQVLENVSELGHEVDLQDIFQRFTFDNICLLVLGFDPNCLSTGFPQVAIEKAFHKMEEALLYRHLVPTSIWKLQRWLQIGEEKKLRKALDTFEGFLEQWITRKKELQQLGESEDFDLLKCFLEKEDNDDCDYKSNKFLRDMSFNLMGAGRDTVAAGLTWVFWFIGANPLVESKILQEMKANLQLRKGDDNWKIFSSEELSKLIYLHAVICESLRLYPPLPFNHLVSIGSDKLPSGHHVGKNMRIIHAMYSVGRMEQIWGKDCLEFKPERWISEKGQMKHVPSHKFVFGVGPRSCLGKNLTFLIMKAVVCAIIWNFSLQLVSENHVAAPSNSVILYMKNGLKVKVSKRHDA